MLVCSWLYACAAYCMVKQNTVLIRALVLIHVASLPIRYQSLLESGRGPPPSPTRDLEHEQKATERITSSAIDIKLPSCFQLDETGKEEDGNTGETAVLRATTLHDLARAKNVLPTSHVQDLVSDLGQCLNREEIIEVTRSLDLKSSGQSGMVAFATFMTW